MADTGDSSKRDDRATRAGTLLAVIGAMALGAVAFWGARSWLPGGAGYERLALTAPCDLRAGPCEQALADGSLRLGISPSDLPLMQTLTLDVHLDGVQADRVQVSIRGLNMDMGLNLTELLPLQPGHWQGETILPICSQRRMEWEAAVLLDAGRRVEIPFPFHTVRP
jgi:hypothetical protein